MKSIVRNLALACLITLANTLSAQETVFPILKGTYFGQDTPGTTPEVFAPGIVSTENNVHSCVAISPDGNEIFWSCFTTIDDVRTERIWFSEFKNDTWIEPALASFISGYREGGPRYSHGGNRIYYTSLRPTSESDSLTDANIWYVERTIDGWSEPQCMDKIINSEHHEWYPSIAKNGNLYYMSRKSDTEYWDIYVSIFENGKYQEPVRLEEPINTSSIEGFSFVDPDEKYLIFHSDRENDEPGRFGTLYITFKDESGKWGEVSKLYISDKMDYMRFAGISPDGKFFFFSNLDNELEQLYWVDIRAVKDLKVK